MGASTADLEDGSSDYGSDFTPDEEDILSRLLQLQQRPPKLISDVGPLLADIEDEGKPQLSRPKLPDRIGFETREGGWEEGEARLPVEMESNPTNRKFSSRNVGETNLQSSV